MNKTDFRHQVFSLSERIYPMVARMLGNTADAEDAIQEIMTKLWLKREKLENHPNIKAFVFLTARNYCLDQLRKSKPNLVDINSATAQLSNNVKHQKLEWKELNKIILNILEKLPAQQKEVLIMRDIDGYKNIEIAFALDLKVEYIRVLLSRARRHVSKELKRNYGYERR
jgi:RNA polymerase sigma-70 factor (ECF subfamily)